MEKYIKDTALTRDFCKGQSAKLFKKVVESKEPLRVTRNGKDYVVILGMEQYIQLMDKAENYDLRYGVKFYDKSRYNK